MVFKNALLIAFVCASTPALADEVTLGRSVSDLVFVWKDGDAHAEAMKLIGAGIHKTNPSLITRLMSCMVPSGTKAVIVDAGFASHTVLITSGDNAGCRGDIPVEDVRK